MKKNVLKTLGSVTMAFGLCSVSLAQPNTPAPEPPLIHNAKIISIFGDTYGNLDGINYNPSWEQPTVGSVEELNGESVLVYTGLTYQGTEFPAQNFSDMTTIHMDIWSDANATLRLSPISSNPPMEQAASFTLTGSQWNSIDIPLASYTNMQDAMYNIWQFKVDQGTGQTIYINNWYVYNEDDTNDTQDPVITSATAGTVGPNKIELILNGTDDSGAIFYEISYNGITETANGKSGLQCTYEVLGLDGGTTYNFTITPKDRAGNEGVSTTVSATTESPLPVPTVAAPDPTQDETDVFSIYSDKYVPSTSMTLETWGSQTQIGSYSLDGNQMIRLENLTFMGIHLNDLNPIDLDGMTTLHIDIWTPNETVFKLTLIDGQAEKPYLCAPLNLETWNSFDISLDTDFAGVNLSNITQIKIEGSWTTDATVYFDNLYFYNATPTGLDVSISDNVKIISGEGSLTIEQANNEAIIIYDLPGKVVYSNLTAENTLSINLEKGIYLVNVGGKTSKVLVK
ncbi:MAG: DUF6383 domain-containing protein [Candidatus Azobacteroides sp.]|nr:DUF6383 domain-containing protein [Candidatus Azobacteroides sp.]